MATVTRTIQIFTGLLASLCLMVQPLMAGIPCCCRGKLNTGEPVASCCKSADSDSNCCEQVTRNSNDSDSVAEHCCGLCPCCSKLPTAPIQLPDNQFRTSLSWFATAYSTCADLPLLVSLISATTSVDISESRTHAERLATLCVWRN